MPELPEVETTRQGISSGLCGREITDMMIRHHQLRQPVPPDLRQRCISQRIHQITRRGKYLIVHLDTGYILIHLGMSGHLRVLPQAAIAQKHDHIDMVLSDGQVLRYNDPRRFGLWLYDTKPWATHPLISNLGPEPLEDMFNATYLHTVFEGRRQPVKSLMMTNQVVVGVGNIYACESLFLARIHPLMPAGNLSSAHLSQLVNAIKTVLQRAIDAGGTTLKDFYTTSGKPGYFSQQLQVYGRDGQPCYVCQQPIESIKIAGRSSFYCPSCQCL